MSRKTISGATAKSRRRYVETTSAADDGGWVNACIVAARLGVSLTYVAILCEAGEFGEISRDADGKRIVRATAVDTYLAKRNEANAAALSPQAAAKKAGMYSLTDAEYIRKLSLSAGRKGENRTHGGASKSSRKKK